MEKGVVIILNGPSSGGKTTLSKNLQKLFPSPLYYTSYDITNWYMVPPNIGDYDIEDVETEFLTVMYSMAKAASDAGRSIVVDNCFFDTQEVYEKSLEILKDNPVLFVRVRCPVEELRRREIARGDRAVGKAEWQETHIKPKDDSAYDIVVDTYAQTSEKCAGRIIEALDSADFQTYKNLYKTL